MIPTAVAPVDGTRPTQNTSLFLRQTLDKCLTGDIVILMYICLVFIFLALIFALLPKKSNRKERWIHVQPVYFQFPHLRPERSGPRSNFSGGHTQEGVRSDVNVDQKA
ncbi:hypothetical protein SprV_0501840600 [Sparganum proliferum]